MGSGLRLGLYRFWHLKAHQGFISILFYMGIFILRLSIFVFITTCLTPQGEHLDDVQPQHSVRAPKLALVPVHREPLRLGRETSHQSGISVAPGL